MMTLQAREWTKGAHRLRHYPADSTRAKARLAVLAIIAGGNTDIRTFDALEQHGEFRTLDLEREDFLRALFDLCCDLLRTSEGRNGRIFPETLDALMDEIHSQHARRTLCCLMIENMRADHGSALAGKLRLGDASQDWPAR